MNKLIPDVVRCKSVEDYIKWCAKPEGGKGNGVEFMESC